MLSNFRFSVTADETQTCMPNIQQLEYSSVKNKDQRAVHQACLA